MNAVELKDEDGLREHLDALNESGVRPIAVGFDAERFPFLIALVGPYAESADVFFDSPWRGDVDYGEIVDGEYVPRRPHCDECQGHVHGIEDLRFPVTVMARPVACSTCGDTRVTRQEHQAGAPGSGGEFPCPDCSPRRR